MSVLNMWIAYGLKTDFKKKIQNKAKILKLLTNGNTKNTLHSYFHFLILNLDLSITAFQRLCFGKCAY